MGLKLRLNLFYDVDHAAVYCAYSDFYTRRGRSFLECNDEEHFTLHYKHQNWTVLDLDGGWEWVVRREAQLYVSRILGCKGFLIFVFDGNYWGYEFFKNGLALDQFVQAGDADGMDWFPGKPCQGDANLLSAELTFLTANNISAYLVQNPAWAQRNIFGLEDDRRRWSDRNALNVPVREGDEFARFDECAVLDFLRFLDVPIALNNHRVAVLAPKFRSFSFA